MEHWNRRSVLATGAVLTLGTGVAAGKTKRTDGSTPFVEADGWSSIDGGAQRARRASAIEPPATVAWRTDGNEPVVVDGTAYLGGESVRALDTADGSLAWETDLDGRTLGLTVVDGTVYAGGAELVALDATTGDAEWSSGVGSDGDVSPPVVASGTAYVLDGGSLYAFDASDGTHRWERDTVTVNGQAMSLQSSPSQLVAANGSIWAVLDGSGSDGLAELDPETGETRWSGYVDAGTGGLAATDGTLLVENNSLEAVYTFDAETKSTEHKINDAYVTAADTGVAVTQGRYQLETTPLEDADATDG
ncbi:outer membrane protein assembly factor BamB family protein [Natronococcus occultus]|uniref:Pyrrolo-quinoline quinone repeat domain-containing protein n=1 Tax=Natronococcus occultus SP4 TaxID=694430 RepID=L0K3L9_9EURY|nr:PQQ-binding-like beta-propeller repeat protein [Natronococcus occultus]AGB38703.1 hypothetical protein Natoc_2948 [Natronococcus occultus SP4]